MKSFVKQFVALVKGDDATVVAEKNYRKAKAALETQLAIAKGDLVTYETELEDAQETVANALVNNGENIGSDSEGYVGRLLNAEEAVSEAEDNLESHKLLIKFFEDKLNELDSEESVPETV